MSQNSHLQNVLCFPVFYRYTKKKNKENTVVWGSNHKWGKKVRLTFSYLNQCIVKCRHIYWRSSVYSLLNVPKKLCTYIFNKCLYFIVSLYLLKRLQELFSHSSTNISLLSLVISDSVHNDWSHILRIVILYC